MFLANPTTFPWDLAIALMLATATAVFIVCTVFLRRHPRPRRLARLPVALFRLVTLCCALAVAYGSFIEPRLITVTRLPVHLGTERAMRMVVLSDFHVGPYKGAAFLQRVVRRVNELRPDIVILAGDFVLEDRVTLAAVEPLAPLKQLRTTLGTFAVLGNHDHGIHRVLPGFTSPAQDRSDLIADYLRQIGVTVLVNRHATVSAGSDRVAIAGVDDAIANKTDMGAALAGIPDDMPVILAAHNPDVILNPLSRRATLIVAGHTHGGQIRLPFVGPLSALPTRLGQRYDQGLFQISPETVLAITRGVGESGVRARLFAPPEILVLEYGGRERPE